MPNIKKVIIIRIKEDIKDRIGHQPESLPLIILALICKVIPILTPRAIKTVTILYLKTSLGLAFLGERVKNFQRVSISKRPRMINANIIF
tara:strand:+ start:1603 stop:1872 length:270 start_codon:yes stop_codon:yes gene_type:complete